MDITLVLCFTDRQKAQDKANGYLGQGYNVRMIDGTDMVVMNDFSSDGAKVIGSKNDSDWTVVIVSRHPIQ